MPTKTTKKSPARTPAKAAPKPKPKPSPEQQASRLRRKRALVDEIKAGASPERTAEIRAELDTEPLASLPVLTVDQLRRL